MRLVWAREPIPEGPSVFLAGPTPAAESEVRPWRPDAVEALEAAWSGENPLTVLTPESRGERADRYADQFAWENSARASASAVLFWIPRDVTALPGFTTNVEFGFDVAAGRCVVLGAPPDCPNPERNRYLVALAGKHGVPVAATLPEAAEVVVQLLRNSRRREPWFSSDRQQGEEHAEIGRANR
ncbi:nucleoside 2-deoxyribosyltransferase domain-containing protein [Amycolatopsis magusensis]|uniref:nucleoside 2-deoxyribosyltransferase domain-containing protein n=1 Tax=Amycolatopsis magusensis TaxID=882444 RepID=UPI0024A86423|nr:nucleoside 2-deoxyribosyltransferase domain-containing protein [Amycolatopsis magusensis]MDI5982180.1 nucleoside 2-deoxyribosyltransferase domain-containing protein [Amycolatopsis magusensis]